MMLAKMKAMLKSLGYTLYTRPYELNIVGVRSTTTEPNRFDDKIHVFFKRDGIGWDYHVFDATTDPGTFWLKNPTMPQGTAILDQGQYKGCYQIGLHRGKYTALVQRGPVTVVRDYNRDAVLDFFSGRKQTGLFGINIHRASVNGATKTVDKYSAGCQVFENASDFGRFIDLCEEHRRWYGNKFSYTLLDFREVQRANARLAAGAFTLALSIAAGYYYFKEAS